MSTQRLRAALCAAVLATPFASPATAHEDDPKILDRKPPVPGTGFIASAAPTANGGGATAAGSNGFPSDGVELSSWLTLADLGYPSSNGNDCWGYTSPSGREYALMCTTRGTVVVEVTTPTSPVILGRIDGPNSTWRDVKTYDTRAYVVSEGGSGIQVIDLTNVDSGTISLENTITGQGTDATHNVAIDEDSGFLYRTGGGPNGLRIYSLANPSTPQFVGQWQTRYVHDAQIVTYTSGPYAGREIAYCCSGFNGGFQDTGLSVLDVTDKSNIQVLSQVSYPGREYSHQGWLSGDRTRFYLGDELDEGNSVSLTSTRVFDVSDPANATYIGVFANDEVAIGHNMYERDGFLFQANYTSGLRIFDLNQNLNDPPEVAYFDTAPNSSSVSFNGLWSCFVGFPSGTILGSDRERGLFVLRFDQPDLEIALTAEPPTTLDPSGDTVDVTITELEPGALDPANTQLVYDAGAGTTVVPLVSNGGSSFTAVFPSIACGSTVEWYVAATSTNGLTVTAPAAGETAPYTSAAVNGITVARSDDMESTAGWVGGAPGDTATSGQWERGNPNGTDAQPEDDNTPTGTQCWFTGQAAPGANVGNNDVDDGITTLFSPTLDMASLQDPVVSYFRWYSNDEGNSPNADVFDIDISNDGGATWTRLERVGPSGPGTSGGWIEASFRVRDFVPPTAQMQVRFIASDLGTGSIVEAAIDDFRVEDVECGDGIGTLYCTGAPNSTGSVATILGSGSASIAANDLVLTAVGLPFSSTGYMIVSRDEAFVVGPGGSQGNVCVGGQTGRYLDQVGNSGLLGAFSTSIDVLAIPQSNGAVAALPGETFRFQVWYRDANPTPTSNFTRGYAVTFQ
ncbi:MAG: choice-of-anchor B family protein [Planctomycetota bacterium]